MRSMQVYLHSQGAFTQTAPYSAASQLAYLVRKEFLDAVLGSASCLIFGAEKVITTFDWASSSFLWVEQKKCLTKLGLNQEQFASLCLLAGASLVPPMPEIDNDTSIPKMQAARSLMSRAGNNIDIIVHEMKDDNYREAFHRARYAVKFPIIMSLEGEVEAENWKERPQDVHEFIGRRLPEEIYFYLSRGVVGPRVLNWRTRMLVLETPPLDGGNSQVYKDLVENKLLPLRAQALALMTQSLNRYYQKQDVDLVCWWDERASKTLDIPDRAGSTKSIENWHVTSEKFSSLADQRDPGASLWYAISSLSKESDAKSTVTPRESSSSGQLVKVQDVRANAVWRFLADRGYINSDHTLSAWGKALKTAFDRAADDKLEKLAPSWSEVEEAIFIAFELLRLDLLGTENMFQTPPYSGAPMKGTDTDKAFALLISRIACLATFQHAKIGYTGPLSRHLLAYHQCAASVRDALRDLLEMHACSMLLSGAVNREWETTDYSDVGDSLPFMNEPDLGLGLMVKCYLDEQSSELNRRQDIGKWLPHATDIQGDLNKAWKIWAAVSSVLTSLSQLDKANYIFRSMQGYKQLRPAPSLQIQGRRSRKQMNGWHRSFGKLMHQMALLRMQIKRKQNRSDLRHLLIALKCAAWWITIASMAQMHTTGWCALRLENGSSLRPC